MKWIVIIAFVVIAAAWVSFLQKDRRSIYVTGLLFGFLPFVIGPWHLMVAPYAIPMWNGYCKGWEISLIDVLAISVLMVNRLKIARNPLQWPLIIYVIAATVAVVFAKYPMFALAYSIQLVRVLLVFFAVSRVAAREEGAKGVFSGLVIGLTLQLVFVIQAKLQGAIQSGGSFGHQNLLGYVTHMVLLTSFALLLGGRWKRFAILGFISGATVIILTASRATIMVAGIGILITYIVCAATNWTSRKGTFGFITLGLMVLAVPLAQESLGQRFAAKGGQLFAQDTEREAFEYAAHMIISDHPFGVGPNHYVYVANLDGYNNKAKITWAMGSRSANVHNTYLLVNAETGYLGLLAFCGLLGGTIFLCFSYASKYKKRGYSELIAGVGCGVVCVAIHSKFEWMFVTFQAQYVIFITIGLASGCIVQGRVSQKRKARNDVPTDELPGDLVLAAHGQEPALPDPSWVAKH